MHFRPYPLLTVLTLIGLGILVWLGSWQWSRMDDKAEAISAFEAVANRAPVPLETALCGEAEAGQAVTPPAVDEDSVLRFWGRGPDGASGWRLFAPADRPACAGGSAILVETGFAGFQDGETSTVASVRLMPVPGASAFAGQNDAAANEFYRYDAAAMEAVTRAGPLDERFWLAADRGLPADLAEVPPSRHLGYALTWFGMAAVLVAVFLAFHAAHGRLRFTRR